jgi:valyl-tRNA synthetase
MLSEDFVFAEEQLTAFQKFSYRLWDMGKIVSLANEYSPDFSETMELSYDDKQLLSELDRLAVFVSLNLERYSFSYAQEKLCQFVSNLEGYAYNMKTKNNIHISLSILKHAYEKYLVLLHPFMPFVTEELHFNLYSQTSLLATAPWPRGR